MREGMLLEVSAVIWEGRAKQSLSELNWEQLL